jgi:2-polyprenyl-3-methyl-5-hydroxy-6-metoxy-1,4-benzoquinol methylase
MSARQHIAAGACPQCGGETVHAFDTTDLNRRIDDARFSYARCRRCELVFLRNVPADLVRYYPQDYYVIARSLDELAAWANFERYKLDIILKYRNRGRLIEVGPASGAFAYLAKTAGFQVTAIEMDRRCSEYLATQVGIDVIHSADEARALETAPPADVIAMWHVIEHLVDPWEMLEVAAGKLRPGGILVLAAPNPGALQFRLFRRRWTHVDAPRHLWLIPPQVLAARGAGAGLSLCMITTRDAGSLFWNRFGWQQSLANRFASHGGRRLAALCGRAFAMAASIVESREGKGSAYTIVLEKPA